MAEGLRDRVAHDGVHVPPARLVVVLMNESTRVEQPFCSNCADYHGAIEVCLVGALAGVVHDRLAGAFTEDQIRKAIAETIPQVKVDKLWSSLGPVIDTFEDKVKESLPNAGTREKGERL